MNEPVGQDQSRLGHNPRAIRWQTRTAALAGITLIGLVLCAVVAYPFLPALAWALALAVIAFPIHAWLRKRIANANWSAGLTTFIVAMVIVVPIVLVAGQLAREATLMAAKAETMAKEGKVDEVIDQIPHARWNIDWVRQHFNPEAEARRLVGGLGGNAAAFAQGSLWVSIQFLVCLFTLFFALRDWRHLLDAIRDLFPIPRHETDFLFTRVADTIHATVYATVMANLIQGISGGLLFWALGIPAALLWGVVMAILGIIPLVGAFLVWLPVSIALAANNQWWEAGAVVAWGLIMAGPVGNWLYATLAGGRMRLHPVPVLIAFIGGLAVFGVSGMVLGPVILSVTMGLIDVWRRRLAAISVQAAELAH